MNTKTSSATQERMGVSVSSTSKFGPSETSGGQDAMESTMHRRDENREEVIRASYGLEFGDRGSPMTNQISFNEGVDDVRSSVVNPLFGSVSYGSKDQKRNSVSSAVGGLYSDARRDDMKEEIRMMREMQLQYDSQRDELMGILAKEREKHDASNARTMALLQKKDDVIDELSLACDGARERNAELEGALEEERQKRRDAEHKVQGLMMIERNLRDDVKEQQEMYEKTIKGLHEEMDMLHENVMHKAMEVDAEREHRTNVESHMNDVAQAMDAAEEVMGDMERQFEKEKRRLEQRCVAMEEFISEKLGLDIREHVGHLPSLSVGIFSESVLDDSHNVENSRLLKANRALEEALVRHAIKTKKIGMIVDGSVSEVAVPSFIRDTDTLEEDTVDTLKEEVEQLARAHQMAQQVALQAEAELMAALDRESDLKEKLDAQSNNESAKEEEERWREDALDKIVDLEDTCTSLQEALSASQGKVTQLEESLNQALDEKLGAEKALREEESKKHETFVQMHAEIQSLRANLYDNQRILSARDAKIASLEAVQNFSLDLSDWKTMDISKIDPTSAPVEFLVQSLREAAHMQTELLQSLSEMSYVNEQSQHSLEAIEHDMERLLSYLDSYQIHVPEQKASTFADKLRLSRQEDIESLRSQVERAVAIQEGQAEAYCLMAAKIRDREAEKNMMLENTSASLRQNEEFLRNLETALAAMKSGLAKVALVQDGEDKANEILAIPCTADDALEIAIRVSDTLNELAQAISGTMEHVDSSTTRKMEEMQQKYQSLVSAYEAAKTESRHARYALEQLKLSMTSQGDVFSHVTTPMAANTATSVSASPNNSVLHFVDKFEALLDESTQQERRIRELEAEKANRSHQTWNSLVAKRMLLQQTQKVWRECEDEMKSLENKNAAYVKEINELREHLLAAETALESSMRKQALMTDRHNQEMEKLKNIYSSQVASVKANAATIRASSETEINELIENAALETQEACRRDFEGHVQQLEVEIKRLQSECQNLANQRDSVIEDFKRFQEVKNASIALLEKRLNISTQQDMGGPVPRKEALSVIEEACNSDAAHAALEQAKFEKSERERLEREMKRIISQQSNENIPPSLSGAHMSNQFKDSLRKAEAQIDELSHRLKLAENNQSVDPKEMEAWRNEADRLQQDIINMTLAMR